MRAVVQRVTDAKVSVDPHRDHQETEGRQDVLCARQDLREAEEQAVLLRLE